MVRRGVAANCGCGCITAIEQGSRLQVRPAELFRLKDLGVAKAFSGGLGESIRQINAAQSGKSTCALTVGGLAHGKDSLHYFAYLLNV
jgi:hypothetical protein